MAGRAVVEIGQGSRFARIAVLGGGVNSGIVHERTNVTRVVVANGFEILRGRERVRIAHKLRAMNDDVAHGAEGEALGACPALEELRQRLNARITKRAGAAVSTTGVEIALN